ncbi:MAG: ShlB/FhaC/HecB family hemolysin secretion/activation protein [Cyanobacteria bacterium P01_A01_bin.105]
MKPDNRALALCDLKPQLLWSSLLGLVWPVTMLQTSVLAIEGAAPAPLPSTLAQVSSPESPDIPPLPPESPIIPTPPAPETPEQPDAPPPEAPPETPRVEVSDIQVVGSTVFDDDDFAPILTDFEGQALTLEELRQAADAVTQLYLNNGYITSRAILANQTVTDGVVQLQVIEGRLADIEIEGAPRLQGYVRDRIALGSGIPLSQVELENQLRLLRIDPLIENIEASLRAGEGLGESLLLVRVTEAEPVEAHLIVDTSSPTSVGVVRMGAEVTYRNPLGYGDQLSATAYRATTGGSHVYGVTYQAPVNAMNGTLTARYLPSNFRIIDPPSIAALNVRGSADVYELSYRQPVIRTPQEELALSLGFRHRSGRTLISTGFTIDESRTSVVQFGQDYLRRDPQGAWALRSQFSLGTELLDATRRPSPLPDGQFFSWLGQVQRAQVLNSDNLLIVQADVQLSANSLLGSEQFVIGGPQSVRGYSQNARFGDNGLRLSVEDRIVAQRDEAGAPILQIAPFVDLASVWNSGSGTANQQNFLLGTGVGFLYQPVEPLNLRVDVGVPLVNLNEPGDSPQDAFIYLLIDYEL